MIATFEKEQIPALKDFDTIALDQLSEAQLMQRVDVKFLFNFDKLESVLRQINPDYFKLQIGPNNVFNYKTTYYDTLDMKCFKDANIKKPNRFKIRKRIYLDSDLAFLEVKKKVKGLRTDKVRIESDTHVSDKFNPDEKSFLNDLGIYNVDSFVPMLDINYKRICLVSKDKKERVTLDFDIQIQKKDRTVFFDGLVIAELKKNKFSAESSFLKTIKSLGIEKRRVSKYAIGMVLLTEGLGHQRYKTKVSKIKSISKLKYGSGNC